MAVSLDVLACAPATTARAQPAKLDFALSIDAPADARCTSAKALQDVIEARVGRLVFLDDPHPARRIDVQVQRDAQTRSWSEAIVMRDAAAHVVGERRVEA
ncbi:MAG TPA: hypothetical protein VHM19_12415, partial [Polyangiales bacterium]|nr:hypothetical protein [Polyangiales bacterium]